MYLVLTFMTDLGSLWESSHLLEQLSVGLMFAAFHVVKLPRSLIRLIHTTRWEPTSPPKSVSKVDYDIGINKKSLARQY